MDYNEEKKVEVKTSYTGVFILGAVAFALACLLGYNYFAYTMVPKDEFKEKYIKKDDIAFDDLPSYVKSDYISKYEHNTKLGSLNDQVSKLRSAKPEEKIVQIEKVVEKVVKVPSNIDRSKYDTYKCYEMIGGDHTPSDNCIKRLKDFLDKNKNSTLFEVIGVANKEKFNVFKQINDKKLKQKVVKLEELAQKGLTQKRVEEAVWEIKKYLGRDTNVHTATYHLDDQGKKGFILRAYK